MSAARSDALVVFGATGDLAHKKIFPALQAMIQQVKGLRLDLLRRLPHLIQLATVALWSSSRNPCRSSKTSIWLSANAANMRLMPTSILCTSGEGGAADQDACHAHAVHRAAGGELAAPLPFRLRTA